MMMRIPFYVFFLLFPASLSLGDGGQMPPTQGNPGTPEAVNQQLLQGWNTWNNPSLLSHVRMPDGLNLQFKMRKRRGGPQWLANAYVASPRYNFAEKIRPLQHAYDGSYTALQLEWEGVKARVQSATDGDDLVLLYSPEAPTTENHILVLETGMLWNKPGHLRKEGEVIIAECQKGETVIRAIGEQMNVRLPLGGPHFTFDSNREVAVYTGRERMLEEVRSIIAGKKADYEATLTQYGDLRGAYEALQSVVAWNLFYDAANDRAISSVSRIWNEAWNGYIIFDWDTYFIALLAAIDNKALAYANVFAITSALTESGFIPNVSATFHTSNDRSQPPVGSMIVKMIYDKYGEPWFLEEVFDELLVWNRWWATHRDNQGYLSWGSDPHPQGLEPHTKQAAQFESGLDNSPMFDAAVWNADKNMLELASAGLMGMYVADCNYLASIALILGRSQEADELNERAEKYSARLADLWDEEMGFYRDKDLVTGAFTKHKSPTHFYPMIAGVPTQEQTERMVGEHLLNPEEFFGDYMIPSISRDNPAYGDNSYWRGRIWAPMNFLVYIGLQQYDLPEARRVLANRSEDLILKEWKAFRHVHENYNAETGEGDDMHNSDPFYAWGGLLGFIPLMEEGYVD